MSEVHTFHSVRRAVQLSAASVAIVLFAVQFYLDRHAMRRDKQSKSFWRSKRVLRVSGAWTAALNLIIGIDVAGVFGVYGVAPVFILSFLMLVAILSAFVLVLYRALLAAFPFTFGNSAKALRRLRRGTIAFFVLVCLCQFTRELVHERLFQVVISILELILAACFLGTVLTTFFLLWRQQRFVASNKGMRRSSDTSQSGREAQLERIVKQWRIFSLLIALVGVGFAMSFALRLQDNIENFDKELASLEEITLHQDITRPPDKAPFDSVSINIVAVLLLIYFELWYTWMWRSPPETDDLSTTSISRTESHLSSSSVGHGNIGSARTKPISQIRRGASQSEKHHARAKRTRTNTLGSLGVELGPSSFDGRAISFIEMHTCAAPEDGQADDIFRRSPGKGVVLDIANSPSASRAPSPFYLADSPAPSAAVTRSPSPSVGSAAGCADSAAQSNHGGALQIELTACDASSTATAARRKPEHSV